MSYRNDEIQQLALEHGVLLRYCGALQGRCSEHAQSHAQEIEVLRAEIMRLRASVIARDSALAWEREARLKLEDTLNGWKQHGPPAIAERADALPPEASVPADADPALLESSLRAADLVICQSGCVTQDSFWRVEDHCKRTGKTCVLVEQPDALRIVRVHPSETTRQFTPAPQGEEETS